MLEPSGSDSQAGLSMTTQNQRLQEGSVLKVPGTVTSKLGSPQ